MSSGLTNAPSTFQRALNNLFAPLSDNEVVIYLDHMLITSNTIPEALATFENSRVGQSQTEYQKVLFVLQIQLTT